jgi:hypothetical protein
MIAQFGKLFLRLSLFLIPLHLVFADTGSGLVRGIADKAFHCAAISIEASGKPPFGVASNSWVAHICCGVSRNVYPYFLIRESKQSRRVDVVFFNDQGRGFFVELPLEGPEGGTYFVLRRKGGGEGGAWQYKQIITFENSESPDVIRARVSGSETFTRLMVFKKTSAWELNYSFKQADISPQTLKMALAIDKKLIESD